MKIKPPFYQRFLTHGHTLSLQIFVCYIPSNPVKVLVRQRRCSPNSWRGVLQQKETSLTFNLSPSRKKRREILIRETSFKSNLSPSPRGLKKEKVQSFLTKTNYCT